MRTVSTPNLPNTAAARRAKAAKRAGRAKVVLARPAPPQGWDTSDEHELLNVGRRRNIDEFSDSLNRPHSC